MTLHRGPLPVECVFCGTGAPLPPDVLRDVPDETSAVLLEWVLAPEMAT